MIGLSIGEKFFAERKTFSLHLSEDATSRDLTDAEIVLGRVAPGLAGDGCGESVRKSSALKNRKQAPDHLRSCV
jgi:hypothetical protein